MLYKHITELIGNTPLLEIPATVHGLANIDLYAKLEYLNPFGSVKDRSVWGMIRADVQHLQERKPQIIEASSGNTAKALQALAGVYGASFKTLTNRVRVTEVKKILQLMGAEIEELPGLSECPDPNAPNDVFSTIAQLISADPDRYYYPSQYTNDKNVAIHYEATGPEIEADIGSVDYWFGGLGTTGSTRGAGAYLKTQNPALINVGIVADKDDFIPGIRKIDEMWEVGLFDKGFYDAILTVDALSAIDATLALVKRVGILAGPTSGASYHGALAYLGAIDAQLSERKKAVFIACDRLEWYVSYFEKRRPDLFGDKPPVATLYTLSQTAIEQATQLALQQAEGWIAEHNPLIIDLRGNMAYRIGHIANSINLLDRQLEEMLYNGMPFSPERPLLLVCPVGEQSKRFAAYLVQKGYSAASLQGGIVAWRDAGKPLNRIASSMKVTTL